MDEHTRAEVFISYKSERRKAAEHLAAVLECYGYKVWFDYHLIVGHDFGIQIGQRLEESKAVIVLWCSMSVASKWVLEEATFAEKNKTIVPVMIEPCQPPPGFARNEYVDLCEWKGSPRSERLDKLLKALEKRTGRDIEVLNKVRAYEATWRRFGSPALKAFALESPIVSAGAESSDLQSRSASAGRILTEAQKSKSEQAALDWPAARDSANQDSLLSFEQRYSDTPYAERAREHRAVLSRLLPKPTDNLEPATQAYVLERLRSEKRIQVRAASYAGAPECDSAGWFLPGSGETEWFKDHEEAPEMVLVPAGSFVMGSTQAPNEGPTRTVTFARPLAVSRATITFAQWDSAFRLGGINKNPGDESWGRSNHPVINVSWHDAVAYCSWLKRLTGHPYRLPTEAEWEFMCRAGTTTPYWQGSMLRSDQAQFASNDDAEEAGVRRRRTVPVTTFARNPWGLYQVHGNVWEWVADGWQPSYDGAPCDGSERTIRDPSLRVMRGGAWSSGANALRSSYRGHFAAEDEDYNIGFRVVRAV